MEARPAPPPPWSRRAASALRQIYLRCVYPAQAHNLYSITTRGHSLEVEGVGAESREPAKTVVHTGARSKVHIDKLCRRPYHSLVFSDMSWLGGINKRDEIRTLSYAEMRLPKGRL